MGQRSSHAAINSLYASFAGATLLLALITAAPAAAKGTAAGVAIVNTATATYTDQGVMKTLTSEPVRIVVQEVLDVVVSPVNDAKTSVGPGAISQPLAFRVTNTGNGQEAYHLSPTLRIDGDDFDPIKCTIALDAEGDAIYNAATDAPYVRGSNDPRLAPDQAVIVFTLCDMPESIADSAYAWVDLYATAETKADPLDPKGTVYPAKPDGVEAIVGATTARAPGRGGYLALIAPVITKSQAVTDPSGGTNPMPGAVIMYTLRTELRAGITGAVVSDLIPTGTSYVPGSLALSTDGTAFTALSDARDSDAGRSDGALVEVALGDAAAASTRIVRFKVKINP